MQKRPLGCKAGRQIICHSIVVSTKPNQDTCDPKETAPLSRDRWKGEISFYVEIFMVQVKCQLYQGTFVARGCRLNKDTLKGWCQSRLASRRNVRALFFQTLSAEVKPHS